MTEPLTSPDCDLRDFAYMPLDVVRLRDSETAVIASAEEFRAAVLLWCAAWHQVPAASLPNDDRLLANLSGYGRDMKGWKVVREGALRGFIECSDGRLYHPVIAEKANEAVSKRRSQQKRTANATKARVGRNDTRNDTRNDERNDAQDDERNDERNVVQGKGREEKGKEEDSAPDGAASKYFFESGVIRLSEKDFRKWRESFSNLDLRGELIGLTQWAGQQKDWFFAVSGALAKRNREIGITIKTQPQRQAARVII